MDMNCDGLNDINLDNIPRCPNCNLISLMKLNYKEGKPIVNYCCENNHKGDISLEEYLQKYKANSLTKQDCGECKKKQNEIKGDFFFCSQCNKFLCNNCVVNHPSDNKHSIIIIQDMIHYAKFILTLIHFIVKNVKKIYAYIVMQSINHMI